MRMTQQFNTSKRCPHARLTPQQRKKGKRTRPKTNQKSDESIVPSDSIALWQDWQKCNQHSTLIKRGSREGEGVHLAVAAAMLYCSFLLSTSNQFNLPSRRIPLSVGR